MKTNSWKQQSKGTSPTNPWNKVYKLASGKTRNKTTITRLQKLDGSETTNTTQTLALMIEQLIPGDNPQDHTDHHRTIRRLAEQPIDKKAPGPDGITSETLKLVYKVIPKTITSNYNGCLKTGCFPTNWKTREYFQLLNQAEKIV